MKKKSLLIGLLLILCLSIGACDKKIEKADGSLVTLTCTEKDDDNSIIFVIEQDNQNYEIKKASMNMVTKMDSDEDFDYTLEELEKRLCQDDNHELKKCNAKIIDGKVNLMMEFNIITYTEEIKDAYDIEELDANTLKKVKDASEKDGYSCTIS